MNNSLLNRFTPKEPKFFDYLKEVSSLFLAVSNYLLEALQSKTPAERRDFFHQIKDKEREADAVGRTIFEALESSFITPFDREDIHDLADCLDDVIDLVNSCAKRLAIYNPKGWNEEALELGKVVVEDAKCVAEALEVLPLLKKKGSVMKTFIERLHTLENEADEIYENALIKVFETEKDAVELIKTKEILSVLEQTTDASERIGKVLKTLVVKYA